MRSPSTICLVGLLFSIILAGCASLPSGTSGGPSLSRPVASPLSQCSQPACAAFAGAHNVQVFVEPGARSLPVVHGIEAANLSVWVEVYLLTDASVIHALEDAAARGVAVRVMLDTSPYGGGGTAAQQTLAALAAAGVEVKPASPAFNYTHEKAMIVDGATAYIMTCNLTVSGLGGSRFATNREYGIIDTDPTDVAEVTAIFQADWDRTNPILTDPHLIVSPINARARLLAVLASAHASLQIEDEEMLDPQSEAALVTAAQRGVRVEIVLPAPSAGTPPANDVPRLIRGGVDVRYSIGLYMHAKLIVVDQSLAFVGSENFSANSLDDNRELGIVIADPGVVATLDNTFTSDWTATIATPA